jgi:heterodisulfide reductase subunit A
VLEHGVTIIASGASELKPDRYLYGQDPRVVTGLELQKRFIENDPAVKKLKSAVFVQCVGSRIPERPYCSKVCCTQSIKSALKLKEKNPGMDVYVLYRDMRSYGLREDLYRQARSAGIVFIRYDVDKDFAVTTEQDDLKVMFSDKVLGRLMEIRPDLLILASAVVPDTSSPLSRLYKVPLNQDGFFAEAHVKLRPVDFTTDGVFVCGLAHAPKTIDESITQAQAAAARAVTVLAKKEIKLGGIISNIAPELCSGCLGCVNVCPFNAIDFDAEKFVAEVNPALCKGCGACSAACPSEAPALMGFDNNQLYAQIKSALSD